MRCRIYAESYLQVNSYERLLELQCWNLITVEFQKPARVFLPKESLPSLSSNACTHISPFISLLSLGQRRQSEGQPGWCGSEHHEALCLPGLLCQVAVLSFPFFFLFWGKIHSNVPLSFPINTFSSTCKPWLSRVMLYNQQLL